MHFMIAFSVATLCHTVAKHSSETYTILSSDLYNNVIILYQSACTEKNASNRYLSNSTVKMNVCFTYVLSIDGRIK